MKLHVAENLSFPIDAVTQTFAAIGRKGAGKTYLASMLAEQMLDADAQVVVLDAVGNWWGLRVAEDGKSPGKDIFVVGGEHGDVPLVPEAGAKIARLLVEKRISVVLDISSFRIGERKRFAADFAEEFFHLKKSQRSPVHVFIEEAQLFVPQRIDSSDARMYGAFEAIVRIGRNYGIGCTLISQRPQSVNKEVLSQVECLCVLQVNGSHERKALEEWVQEAGADRKLVGELPGMERGEGYVWSPSWLRIFKRVHFAKKTTFDASATPEVGKATKAAKLSDIDVESLRGSMAEVIAQAEKDDPKALRKTIAALEKQLKQNVATVVEKPVETIVEVPVVGKEQTEALSLAIENLRGVCDRIGLALMKATSNPRLAPAPIKSIAQLPKNFGSLEPARGRSMPRLQPSRNGVGESLPVGEKAILIVVAQNEDGATKDQLTVMTGYKRSSRDAYIQRLRTRGYISEQGGRVFPTQEGIDALGSDYEPLPTGEALQEYWLTRLPEGEKRMLEILIQNGGDAVDRETLSDVTEYKRSSRDAYLQRLSSRKLVESVGRGEVRAAPLLFA